MPKMTWYRPWIIPNDPHTFVARFDSETGKPQDLKFVGLHSIHNTNEEALSEIMRIMEDSLVCSH